MQFKLSALATLTLVSLAAAIPTPGGPGAGQCNTGPVQCCNSVQSADSAPAASLLGLVGAVVGVGIPVGLTCNPISVIGVGGNSCSSQPVCCQNNSFNGIVAIGCTPINLNL